MKIRISGVLFFCFIAINSFAQQIQLQTFPLTAVHLEESPFYHAQQVDMNYILEMEPDRLLAPFLIDAGIEPKAERYPNWENSGLDGHIGGHYLTALAQMYAATGNEKLLERLNYMIDELAACQEKNGNGYVGGIPGGQAMWADIAKGKIDAGAFSLNGKWVPLYNIHKLYAGLRDAYLIAGNEKAKEMLIKLTDWCIEVTKDLSDEQIQDMLRSEHGGLNETFVDVAAITGDDKYMTLARRFSHRFILDPLLKDNDELTGMHANTQIPKVIGYKRIADLDNDTEWANAANFFWETVVNNRTLAFGGNSVREHFNPVTDFSGVVTSEQGPETCNTYNMLRLSKMIYQSSKSLEYVDFYERALYNHILSSQNPDKGGFVYFTPIRPGHYRVYSQPSTSMWCCVGSGLENHGKYGELIYAHDDKDLYVNLFIPSDLTWKEKGISITQETKFPEEEKSTFTITENKAGKFALKIRYPSWVKAGALKVSVNGKAVDVHAKPDEYVSIERKWKKNDKIEVTLPMQTKVETLPDGSNFVAVLHGPIVLAAKTSTDNLDGLFADASRMGHIANGDKYPLNEMPMIVTEKENIVDYIKPVAGKPMTFEMGELVYPQTYKSLELIPFYKLHDARYVMYWQKETPQSLAQIKEQMAKAEAEAAKLAAMTIDMVNSGEQQPESDHFVKSEKSNTGLNRGRHWRDATGWFSYQLKDKNKEATYLRLTYFGKDNGRTFKILINDIELAEETLDGSHGDEFYTKDYSIPDNLVLDSDGLLTVKFVANEGSVAGGIYEVRLMKELEK